jgi:hypothetical protein
LTTLAIMEREIAECLCPRCLTQLTESPATKAAFSSWVGPPKHAIPLFSLMYAPCLFGDWLAVNARRQREVAVQGTSSDNDHLRDDSTSLFDKLDPSNTVFEKETPDTITEGVAGLGIDVEKANTDVPINQVTTRQVRATPSSALFPVDAVGMQPLSNYFERFYTPKSVITSPQELHQQQQVSEYFKGVPRRDPHFYDCP